MKRIKFKSLVPNLITLTGLCFGLSSIRFAFEDQFELGVACILIAAVCDTLDGFFARMLKSSSELGAQLDSLSDFLCFGIAPAILLYMSIMEDARLVGEITVVAYVIFSCLRLAIFNTNLISDDDGLKVNGFFSGVPTPAGSILIILPVTHAFLGGNWAYEHPNIIAAYTIIIGLLLISNIPTYSIKRKFLILEKGNYIIFISLFAMIMMGLINFPWIALNIIGVIYILTIPFSINSWFREKELGKLL
jgi:CDP-diacylglycerol--serine O-phosphatidyltransferase